MLGKKGQQDLTEFEGLFAPGAPLLSVHLPAEVAAKEEAMWKELQVGQPLPNFHKSVPLGRLCVFVCVCVCVRACVCVCISKVL